MSLEQIFGTTGHVDAGQECLRAVVIFAYGLGLVRIAGRRVFGRWAALDIVVSIIIGSNLSRAITGSAPLWGTLLATTVLMALHWALANAAARSPMASRILEGRPVRLSAGGEIAQHVRTRHGVSLADVAEALRQAGVPDASRVAEITLEPSGKISVLKRS